MDSNDLFSFLDHAPEELESSDELMATDAQPDIPRKRKVDTDGTSRNGLSLAQENEPGPSVLKKQRLASPPAPLVVDEVEIEAKREVAASAGLQGAVEAGARLEIRHQVRSHD